MTRGGERVVSDNEYPLIIDKLSSSFHVFAFIPIYLEISFSSALIRGLPMTIPKQHGGRVLMNSFLQ